jgi:4-amino-4-deoxy-L-arabinose transferase-like glycosyltransferase
MNKITFFLFVLGCFAVWVATHRFGIGLITDSYYYLRMAENFAASARLICYEGFSFSLWPPLYPLLLAVPISLGMNGLVAAQLLNMLAYGTCLAVCYTIFLPFTSSNFSKIALAFALLGCMPLYNEANFMMTDMLFCTFCCCFFWAAQHYDGEKKWLYGLVLFTTLAWLLRYVGVALLGVGFFVSLYYHQKTWQIKLKTSALFAFFASLPMFVWFIYNYAANSTLYGNRTWGNGYHLLPNLQTIANYFSFLLIPLQVPTYWQNLGFALLLLVFAYFALFSPFVLPPKAKKLTIIVVFFSITYLALLLALSAKAAFVPLYLRYLAPTSLLVIVLVFSLLHYCWSFVGHIANKKIQQTAKIALCVALSIWVAQHCRITVQHISNREAWGAGGYTTQVYAQKPFVKWLQKQPIEGIIFTNVLHLTHFACLFANLQKVEARLAIDHKGNLTPHFANYKEPKIVCCFSHPEYPQKIERLPQDLLLYADEEVAIWQTAAK